MRNLNRTGFSGDSSHSALDAGRPGPRPTPHERHAAGTMTVRNRSFVHAEGTHCEVPDSFIRSIWSRSSTLLLKRVTAWAIRQKSRKP